MTQVYMWTMPSHVYNRRKLMSFIEEYDIHKWVFGFEHGKPKSDEFLRKEFYNHQWEIPRAYDHIQCRVLMTNDDEEILTTDGKGKVKKETVDNNFNKIKGWFADAGNIQKASDTWDYERKEGHFISSEDDDRIRKQRFYPLMNWQREALEDLENQNDRQIDFYCDAWGGVGKSFLRAHLFETGKAIYVPMQAGIDDWIKTIASEYISHPRKIIAIDVPRSRFEGKKDTEISATITKLNEVLESLKDGIVGDPRYSSRVVNMGAVKIIVFSNYNIVSKGGLSADRYRAWYVKSAWKKDDDTYEYYTEPKREKYR